MKKLSLIDFKSSVTQDYQILDLEKGEEVFVPITTKKQAQEVVRAVNNFDALLDASQSAYAVLSTLKLILTPEAWEIVKPIKEKLESAIDNAEGGK